MLGVSVFNNIASKQINTTQKQDVNKYPTIPQFREYREFLLPFNGCMIVNALGCKPKSLCDSKEIFIQKDQDFALMANSLKQSLKTCLNEDKLNADNVQKAINEIIEPKLFALNIMVNNVSQTELAQKLANARCEVVYEPAKNPSGFDQPVINILINFNNPNKAELVGSIVHEFTHALQASSEEALTFRKLVGDKDTLGKLNSAGNILRNVLRKVEFAALTEVFGSPKSPLTIDESVKVVDAMKAHFPNMLETITAALKLQGLSKNLTLKSYYAMAKDEAQAGQLGKQAEDELTPNKSNILPRRDFYTLVFAALADYMGEKNQSLLDKTIFFKE